MKITYRQAAEINGKHAITAIQGGSVVVAANFARCAAHFAIKYLKQLENDSKPVKQ